MTELRTAVYNSVKSTIGYSSLMLAVIYTIGHIFIAMICTYLITSAPLELAAKNAIVEPCVNGVWFYILHKKYDSFRKEGN